MTPRKEKPDVQSGPAIQLAVEFTCRKCKQPTPVRNRSKLRLCLPCAREHDRNYRANLSPEKYAAFRAQKRATLARQMQKPEARQKMLCRNMTRKAILRGDLVRKPCQVCGAKAEAHHRDYSKPFEIEWLCKLHHDEQHFLQRKAKPLHWREIYPRKCFYCGNMGPRTETPNGYAHKHCIPQDSRIPKELR